MAQGTAPSTATTTPARPNVATPSVTTPSTATPGTTTLSTTPATGSAATSAPAGLGGAQTPAATINTTPQSTSRSPSAVQTTNTAHRTHAAPVPGRNSFTMAQASRRITASGYTQVTGLKKDRQGIWRGQAQKDGAPTPVSLDYQGNVTGQ